MKVRGSVIKSIDEFVQKKHSDCYDQWKSKLTKESIEILKSSNTSNWYPVKEGVLEPTEAICQLKYKVAKEGAWESGRHSAENALTGIYKVFVVISTPAFMVKRASRIMTTFYDPTHIIVKESNDKSMLLHLTEIPVNSELIEHRIGGWIERALEICGCKNLTVKMPTSLSKGDSHTTYDIAWS